MTGRKIDLVVRLWEDVIGGGELHLLPSLAADPYVRHTSRGTERLDRRQLEESMLAYRSTLRHARVQVLQHTEDEHLVWSALSVRGFDQQGGEVAVAFLSCHRVEAGRLAEAWILNAPGVDWAAAR